MFEQAVQQLLQKYLRDYLFIDEGGLDSLVVSLWSGRLDLQALELKPEALQGLLGIPFDVYQSSIAAVSVSVPWSRLQSEPVVIRISGVRVAASSRAASGLAMSKAEKNESKRLRENAWNMELKRRKLERLNELEEQGDGDKDEEEDAATAAATASSTFLQKLTTKIVDNLQLVLEDVELMLDDSETGLRTILRLGEIALLSTNANWNEAFVVTEGNMPLRKIARLRTLEVCVANINNEERVFFQPGLLTKMTLHRSTTQKQVEIEVDLGSSNVSLYEFHVKTLSTRGKRKVRGRGRLETKSRRRWRKAITHAQSEAEAAIATRKRKAFLRECQQLYVLLFKKTLKATKGYLPSLAQVEREKLELMENSDKLPFLEISRLRQIAYEEVRMQLRDYKGNVKKKRGDPANEEEEKKRRKAKEKEQQSTLGWLSAQVFGTTEPSDAKTPFQEATAEISDEERQQLFDTIGYDPLLEEQVDSLDLSQIHFSVRTHMKSSELNLVSNKGMIISKLALGDVRSKLEYQTRIQALELDADCLKVFDNMLSGSDLHQVLGPVCQVPDAKLLSFQIKRSDMQRLDSRLQVRVALDQSWQVVFSKSFVESLAVFFKIPEQEFQGDFEREDDEESGLDAAAYLAPYLETYYAAYADTTFEQMSDEKSMPNVHVTFQAPRLVIPGSRRSISQHPVVIISLGFFELFKVENKSKWALRSTGIEARLNNSFSLLSDVSFNVGVELSGDEEDLSVPRLSVDFELPSLPLSVDMASLKQLQKLFAFLAEEESSASQVDDLPTALTSTSSVLDSDDSTCNPPNGDMHQQMNKATAVRVVSKVSGLIGSISIRFFDGDAGFEFSARNLSAVHVQRTFDSDLRISFHAVTANRLNQGMTSLLSQHGDDELVNVFVEQQKVESPRWNNIHIRIKAKFGGIHVTIPDSFIRSVSQSFKDLQSGFDSTAADRAKKLKRDSSSFMFQGRSTKEAFIASRPAEQRTIAFELQVDLIHLQLLSVEALQSEALLVFEIGGFKLEKDPDRLSAILTTLEIGTRDRPLLEFAEEDLKLDEIISIAYERTSGYEITAEPFRLIIDEGTIEELADFLPSFSLPSASSLSTRAVAPEQKSSSSSSSKVHIVINRPAVPFVIEYLATREELSCELRIAGLDIDENGAIVLQRGDVVTKQGVLLGSFENALYSKSSLCMGPVRGNVNPMTRSLGGMVSSLLESFKPSSSVLEDNPEQGRTPEEDSRASFSLVVERLELGFFDIDNSNGVVLVLDGIAFANDEVSCKTLRMKNDENCDVVWLDTKSQGDKVMTLDLKGVVQMRICQELYFRLSPLSLEAFSAAINFVTGAISMIQGFFPAVPSEKEPSSNPAFVLTIPSLNLEVDTFRPRLGNMFVKGGPLEFSLLENGDMIVDLKKMQVLNASFDLVLLIDISHQNCVGVTAKIDDPVAVRLEPSDLYQLNSIFKDNLLVPDSRRPKYSDTNDRPGSFMVVAMELSSVEAIFLKQNGIQQEQEHFEPFGRLCISSLGFESNGSKNSVSVSASMIDVFDLFDETELASLREARVEIDQSAPAEGSYLVQVASMYSRYRGSFVQALFDFQTTLETLRVSNLMVKDLEDEKAISLTPKVRRKTVGRVILDEVRVLVAAEETPFIVRLDFIMQMIFSTDFNKADFSREIQLYLNEGNIVGVLHTPGHVKEVLSEHRLVEDANAIVKLRNEYEISGVRTFSRIDVMIDKVQVDCLIPIVGRVGLIVRHILRTRPSQKGLRSAILDQVTKELGATKDQVLGTSSDEVEDAPNSRYEIQVTVSDLSFTVFGKSHPLLRFQFNDSSTASGTGEGGSSTITETAFSGLIQLREASLLCFNRFNVGWEPIFESFSTSLTLETVRHPHGERGFKIQVEALSPFRANIHLDHVRGLRLTLEESQDLIDQILSSRIQFLVKPITASSDQNVCRVENLCETVASVENVNVDAGGQVLIHPNDYKVKIGVLDQTIIFRRTEGAMSSLDGAMLCAYFDKSHGIGVPDNLTLASGTSIQNLCEMPLTFGLLADSNGEFDRIEMVEHKSRYFVPSERLADRERLTFGVKLTNSDSRSWTSFSWDRLKESNELYPLTLMESSVCILVEVERKRLRPFQRIRIRPVTVIENTLPVTVCIGLFTMASASPTKELAPGETWSVYEQDHANAMIQMYLKASPSAPGEQIPLLEREYKVYEYTLSDSNLKSTQSIFYQLTPFGRKLFSPFWIINVTSLRLHFAMEDLSPFLGDANEESIVRVEESTWENQRKVVIQGWVGEMLPNSRPPWSNKAGTESKPRSRIFLPDDDPSWSWETSWKIDYDQPNAGADGWMYALTFKKGDWSSKPKWNHVVRTRRWVRIRSKLLSNQSGETRPKNLEEKASSTRTSIRAMGFPKCRCALKSDDQDVGSPRWSPALNLDLPDNSNDVFPVQRSSEHDDLSFYELVLSVRHHDSFRNTKVCTLTPRIILFNLLQDQEMVRCIQAGTDQDPVVVGIEQPVPFWWMKPEHENSEAAMQVQIGQSVWSRPFLIGQLREFCVHVPGYGKRLSVEIRRGESGATLFIIFRQDLDERPLYRIENITSEIISCVQDAVDIFDDRIPVQDIAPYASAPFAWIDSRRSTCVLIKFGAYSSGNVKAVIDFNNVGKQVSVKLPPLSRTERIHSQNLKFDQRIFVRSLQTSSCWMTAPSKEPKSTDVLLGTAPEAKWLPLLSQTEANGIFVLQSQEAADMHDHVEYGKNYRICCTSSDGRERILTMGKKFEIFWATRSEEAIEQHEEEVNIEWKFVCSRNPAKTGRLVLREPFYLRPSQDERFSLLVSDEGFLQVGEGGSEFHALHTQELEDVPARDVFVLIDIEGDSRVIRISETSAMSSSIEGRDSNGLLRLSMQFLLDDFGISLITGRYMDIGRPRELLHISGSIQASFIDTTSYRTISVSLPTLRVDNMLDEPTYANVLRRTYVKDQNAGPMVSLSMEKKHTMLNISYFQFLQVEFAEWDVQLDEPLIEAITAWSQNLQNLLGEASLEAKENPFRVTLDFFAFCTREMRKPASSSIVYFVRDLKLKEIHLRVSYFRNKMTDVERAPIALAELTRRHVVDRSAKIIGDISGFYSTEIRHQIFRVVGYSLPGNPGELFGSIGSDSFLRGAARGVATLGSLGTTIAKVDMDYRKSGAKPQNFKQGLRRGGKQIGKGFRDGFQDFWSKTTAGAADGDVAGVGSGMFGLISKPISGIASAIATTSQGLASETMTPQELESEKQSFERSRPPRSFSGSPQVRELRKFDLETQCLAELTLHAFKKQMKKKEMKDYSTSLAECMGELSFWPLPYFVMHLSSHIVFASFGRAPRRGPEPTLDHIYVSKTQRRYEEFIHTHQVEVFWFVRRSVESASSLESAVEFWCKVFEKPNLRQVEALVQSKFERTIDERNIPHILGQAEVQIASKFAKNFSLKHPPSYNVQAIVNLQQEIRNRSRTEDNFESHLESIVLASEIHKHLPILTLVLARAYFATALSPTITIAKRAQYLEMLHDFESIFMNIGSAS